MAQLRRLRDGGTLKLGPLDAVRDFVDARDVAAAVLTAATGPALPHALVNIGSGVASPARALVRQLLVTTGLDVTVHEDAAGLRAVRLARLAAGRHLAGRRRSQLAAAP